jgi:hypothetical protein
VPAKVIGKFVRLLISRLELKYEFASDKKAMIIQMLIDLYSTKKISFPMKIKIVSILTRLLKKKWEKYSISFPWRLFWDDAYAICMRAKKTGNLAYFT